MAIIHCIFCDLFLLFLFPAKNRWSTQPMCTLYALLLQLFKAVNEIIRYHTRWCNKAKMKKKNNWVP